MKTLLSILAAFFLVTVVASAQSEEKIEETVITTDSTGNTTTTKVVRIRTTEDISVNQNAIVINPLKFFFFYNIGYVRSVTPNFAAGFSVQTPALPETGGFGFSLEGRFYPSGKHLRGFYIAPNISQNWLTADGSSSTASVFTIGALAGWQWFPGDDFAIGLGIGFDRYMLSESGSDTQQNDILLFGDYEGTFPALRFDIGYGW